MQKVLLNAQQKKAVTHGGGPLLVIAGAGTGKTTVIAKRIEYLILKKNVSPKNILALTFTEKASQEMEDRIDRIMPYGYTQMWISTFHAFCDRILRSEAIHIGFNPTYTLMSQAQAILFLRNHLFSFNLDYFRPLGNPTKFLEGLLTHFNRLQDEDVTPQEYLALTQSSSKNRADEQEAKKTRELASAFATYHALKIKEGVMDFSDLIASVLLLFRTRKNILASYQKQFEYVLVDEFQDTNFAQNELAILLAGDKKNITVVGDDDQAIYRWRGAAISNIIQFQKRFPKAVSITLTKNYRSTQEILNSSYQLIQHNNPDRLEAKTGIKKKLTSERNIKGVPIELLIGKRVEDEADLVVKKIQEIATTSHRPYSDFAILVRANDHAQSFVRALTRANVPYQFLGPGYLFRKEEIKDLIAYLKVLYNLEDATSLYRVIAMDIFHLDGKDISLLLSFARKNNKTLFEAVEDPPAYLSSKAQKTLEGIAHMVHTHLNRVSKETAGQILYYFLEDSGLLRFYLDAKTEREIQKSQNIALFFDKLKTHETSFEDSSLFAAVDWIDLSMQLGESPLAQETGWIENNAVNLLTVHASKGLEFPVVFLANLATLRFPTRDRSEQIPIPSSLIKEVLPQGDYHMQEERRLFYVGMTRARDELYFSVANFYGEGKRERKISPFVYEALSEAVVERTLQKIPIEPNQLTLLDWGPKELKENNARKTFPITYLSYSQIQTFNICPLHYKLRYILKIPTPPTASQSFGTSIHATLRDFYQAWINKKPFSLEDLLPLLEKHWITQGYTSKKYEKLAKQKAQSLIQGYLEKEFDPSLPPKTKALELAFQLALKDPNNPKRFMRIGGRIDRVDDRGEGKIEIIDYKTGANVPDEKQLQNDLQLNIYALAATSVKEPILFKDPKDVALSLYYLDQDAKLTVTKTNEDLARAKELIFEKAKEIETSEFLCSGSSLCKTCEYKILCSTY